MPRHIKKGDMVVVIAGNLRATYPNNPERRTGRVLRVITDEDRVIVEHPELMMKKHVKPTRENPQGGIVEKYRPIHISNVQPAVDGKPTRVRFESREDGSKVRLAARTGEQIGEALRKPRKK